MFRVGEYCSKLYFRMWHYGHFQLVVYSLALYVLCVALRLNDVSNNPGKWMIHIINCVFSHILFAAMNSLSMASGI